MNTIYLIDASPYIFRAFFSLPETMTAPDGRLVNAVYGYTDFLIQLLKREKPAYIAVAFDGSLITSFRNDIYRDYKANRALPPPELEAQLDLCREITSVLGIQSFISDTYESDDLLGTLLTRLDNPDSAFVLVSNDKDLMQFVGDRVVFWDFAKDRRLAAGDVVEKFGVRPEQLLDYLALTGDSVDNIPGIRGVGPKTAAALLQTYGTLDKIYAELRSVAELPIRGARTVQTRLEQGKEMAELSKALVTIKVDIPLAVELEDLRYRGWSEEPVAELFQDLGFGGIKERLPEVVQA